MRGTAITTQAPFHLEATVRVLQRRPGNLVNRWERDCYLRVLATARGLVLIEVANRGTVESPDVRTVLHEPRLTAAQRAAVRRTLREMLGLDIDARPLQTLMESNPRVGATARALRGLRPPRFANIFETFANVVPFQQISLDAGTAIVTRLIEAFGSRLVHRGRDYWTFPSAERIAEARPEKLRRCGLSARKAESLKLLARAVLAGDISESKLDGMSSPEALRTLIELPGIGPWSAALVLLRGLGRLDVFPPGDVGALGSLRELLHSDANAEVERAVEGFGDLRGFFYFYALASRLLAKGLIHAAEV